MFKKLKDKIEEEFKQAPIKFPVSVQQLAQVISPSQSVNSLSDNNATSSSSLTYPGDMSNVSTDFFSIGGDDDPQDEGAKHLTLHNVDLTASSPSNMTHSMSRSRRSSLSSVTSEASSLFPIYESGLNQNFFQSDLESEMEDGMSGQIEKISKEQLYQSFKKIMNRYNKYKGKYTELMKHYKELQHDNFKTKNVLQESQDKALRRMAELREQCQLEQKAKAHLEESLRNDVEERDHIIDTLKTKIVLLSNRSENAQLIDLESDAVGAEVENNPQSKELVHLKSQNEDLQREIERLKKIKETACSFINRCDTTINEATEDVKSDNIKQKMSELKSEIQKMKVENESLSHLLSRNIITEEDKKSQTENSLLSDLSSLESSQGDNKMDEKDKKIDKLNNLLLKCKEKISSLTAEIKAKNLIIEDNNKKLKESRDEVTACKLREEENALSMAENKKAIHEELNAKEEQIKALTKELKTKENEFIKEKAEVVKSYEDKIRDMTTDFTKEIKLKNELNQKLQEDLRAKEIISGSLDKLKSMEESFASMLEFVKARSCAFEEMAKSKTQEIEKAQYRLEERVNEARKNISNLIQSAKQANSEPIESFVQQKIPELQGEFRNPNIEASENFQIVEKLKSDVINLSKKLEILESELEKARKESNSEREEKDKWREKCSVAEAERERIVKELEEKLNENAELVKALTDTKEKIKKFENEKILLQKASSEKVETESKLKEYIQNYTKLEKENRTMQNDLVERCGKLMKELNESKEKIKTLENQGKEKTAELEKVMREYSENEKMRATENEKLKNEMEALKGELEKSREKMEKLNSDSEQINALMKETEKANAKLVENKKRIEELEAEIGEQNEKTGEMQKELESLQKEISQEKRSSEAARNELEALRNNLKSELKEKDEKSILVDKLTHECNLLLAEIENLKKTHGKTEKKLSADFESIRREVLDKTNMIEKLQQELNESRKDKNERSTEVEELKTKCENLTTELERLKREQDGEVEERKNLAASGEKLRQDLADYEKSTQELNDKIAELTNEKNDLYGELQLKKKEIETLKSSLVAMRNDLSERTKAFEEEKVRLVSENENKVNVLKNEIKFINTKHEEDIGNFEENLNSEMKEVNEKMEIAEKTSAELLEKLERITTERDELKMAEQEKNLKISELESCLQALKMELDEKFNDDARQDKEEAEKHREEIKNIIMRYDKEVAERDEEIEALKLKLTDVNAEELNNRHREEVKQIIVQYQKQIGERDEEMESLKCKISGYEEALEHLKTTKEELKNLQRDLAEKDDSLEEKMEEIAKLRKDAEKVPEKEEMEEVKELKKELEEKISENERLKREKDFILEEEKRNWESKMAALKEKHEKEVRQWNSQRKNLNSESEIVADDKNMEDVELECTSKVAVAALESGSGSIELLQKQLIQQAAEMKELKRQHKREIIEMKKWSGKRRTRRNSSEAQDWLTTGTLENDTEHEYLKNILYEYMMGKEQLVLAKVLSAIVKFNEEQTHKVLEKEQQRQTLLGQLGLI